MSQALAVVIPLFFIFALDFVIFLNTIRNRTSSEISSIFIQFEIAVLLQQGCSALVYANDYQLLHLPRVLLYILSIVMSTCMTASAYDWFRYLRFSILERKSDTMLLKVIYALPTLLVFSTAFFSAWTGWIFDIDKNGMYVTGPRAFLQVFCTYSYVALATITVVFDAIREGGKGMTKAARNFLLFIIPSLIGSYLQADVFRGGYSQVGISFGMILIYLNLYIGEIEEINRLKLVEDMNVQLHALTEQQNKQLKLVNTLSQNYLNVYLIRPKNRNITILKLDGYVTEGLSKEGAPVYPYDATCLKYIQDRVLPEDQEMMKNVMDLHNIEEALYAGRDYVGTYRVLSNGEIHYYQYNYVRIENSDEIIAGFQNVDAMIANEKEQRERLQAALDEAKKANVAKSAFLARMSHDIRTPLNGIIGMIDISEKYPEDIQRLKENRAKAKVAAKHLLALIGDVLDLSKLETSEIELPIEFFDLREIAQEVLDIISMRCAEKGISLHTEDTRTAYEYPYVFGSPLQVRQIALNILGNAVKYNRPGGSITTSVDLISVENDIVTYRTTFSDTGIGMSPEYLEHFFEPFTQEQHGARTEYQGTGLGMAIVKSLVERMNGTVEVESKLNVGTTIRVSIPFQIADASYLPAAEETTNVSLEGRNVLLVEDNELNMEIAKVLIGDLGANIMEAANGKEAVAAFTASAPGSIDVILMDLMMPEMDGYQATAAIRNSDHPDAKSVPIVAMTANAFAEDVQKCLEAGMNAHVAKPIEIPKLKEALARVMN